MTYSLETKTAAELGWWCHLTCPSIEMGVLPHLATLGRMAPTDGVLKTLIES
jgi:hypothetical protein